jgi:hypothetical protein
MNMATLSFASFLVLAAQQSIQPGAMTIKGNDVTIRGCVRAVDPAAAAVPSQLVWSRNNVMITGIPNVDIPNAVGTSGSGRQRFFYWLDDDEDLSKHVGQMVELKGDLKNFEKGEVEIDRHGDTTEIEVKWGGKEQKARVPTAWLRGTGLDKDQEYDILARRIDVDDIRVLGACSASF